MLKAASCDDDWKVFVVVAACVTKVTAEKYDRSVKQSTSCLAGTLKLREQLSKKLHLLDFDNAKFSQFDGVLAMVLCPCLSRRTCASFSLGVPSTNILLKTRDGRSSAGIGTPLRVNESPRLDEEASTNDPNGVSGTSCSMAY